MNGTLGALPKQRARSRLLSCIALSTLASACAGGGATGESGAGHGGDLQVWAEPLGVVQGHANSHLNLAAAESVVTNMSNNFEVTASFNGADTSQFVTFNGGSRQVFASASQMAFSTMDSSGSVVASGRLRPPAGWSVLWGDSSITRNRANFDRVYLNQLAVPTEKFNLAPATPSPRRIEGSLLVGAPSATPFCGGFIGGGCIARSNDGGRTFSIAATDCLRRIDAGCTGGNFYDGSDIETSSDGRVYAAYNDIKNAKIDIYMSTSQTGSLARITMPPVVGFGHPRIKWGPGGLYLLVQTGGSTLSITRYGGGSSRTGAWTTPVTVTAQYNSGSITQSSLNLGNGRFIRVGPQYSFDVGKNETGGDQIRIVFKVVENGHHHMRIYTCTTGATITCQRQSAWETLGFGATADQFMPAIAFGSRTFGGTAWVATYFDTAVQPGGNLVNLVRSIGVQNGFQFTFDRITLELAQTPCPDNRGFWGDYDNMAFGAFGFFMRPFTDSSHQGCVPSNLTSTPKVAALHMSAIQ